MEKVTIIMPVYNSEKTLKKTIESVLNQTYKNIEFIIVNDGSTDGSNLVCKEYANTNGNIKYYKKNNTGVSNTRNYALQKATGAYIMFIDSDDLYCEDYVETMVKAVNINKVGMAICGYKRINYSKNKVVDKHLEEKLYFESEFNILISEGQTNNLFNQIWNKIFLKKIIDENHLQFDEKLSLGEDFRFVINYLQYINKVYTIDKELYLYTNSIDGLNFKYRKDRFNINISNIEILEEYFKKNHFDLNYINRKYLITIMSGIKNICSNPRKQEINDELKKLKADKLVKEKLNIKTSMKYNLIATILKNSSIWLLRLYGKIFICYDKFYNKKRLGY